MIMNFASYNEWLFIGSANKEKKKKMRKTKIMTQTTKKLSFRALALCRSF